MRQIPGALFIITCILLLVLGIWTIEDIRLEVRAKKEYSKIAEQAVGFEGEGEIVSVSVDAPNHPRKPMTIIDHSGLKNENPDYDCWIYVPGTDINYPVCAGLDNSYYLNHTFKGEKNMNGCIFRDCNTPLGEKLAFIYGHNMRSGSMFGRLNKFAEDGIDYFYLTTPEKTYKCEIFSTHKTEDDSETFMYVNGKADYEKYINREISLSDKNYGVGVSAADRTVVLSTCHGFGTGKRRYVVLAKY